MGYALAEAAAKLGARVTLVSGPTYLSVPECVKYISVITAAEMYEAVMKEINGQDIFIGAAAVADYTVKEVSKTKLKKQAGDLQISLTRTRDNLQTVANLEYRPFCVGFCAEDENLLESAKLKLKNKNLDLIIANFISDSFDQDTNTVIMIDRKLNEMPLGPFTKRDLAYELLGFLVRTLSLRET